MTPIIKKKYLQMGSPQERCTFKSVMLSIDRCNEILNIKENKYTKEQVKAIRYYLYQFAEIIQQTNSLRDEARIKG